MDDVVIVNGQLSIPRAELSYRATRSGGPGGQHVNTSSTRVELLWDLKQSPSISAEQRDRIYLKLKSRIADGVLRLTSSGSRSQHQNKEEVTERFAKLIAQALHRHKLRKKTKLPKAAKEARLRRKKKHSQKKAQRRPVGSDE